ncbi:uncharacterized protein LOC111829070 [Capsella rubella]|uniref:uncharacterized protein LOC111829070 n=1 Tax=Capsella rubella TaxID=81985 RepID=UPI000CD5650E|nr:uncharacterized protein LOC111829070 [Capsella rubella]
MKILAWNCQGAGAKLTKRRLEEMCRMYSPGFLFLSETKNDLLYLQELQTTLRFDCLQTIEPMGTSGGLALMYSRDYPVHFLYLSDRLMDIETIIDGNRVYITFVYGDPVVQNREKVWERLTRIGINRSEPWFMIGDFNEITGNHEKKGGKRRSESSFLPFRTMIENCGMLEFPFTGNFLSWAGRRQCGLIRSRLDRALGNEEWHHIFSHTNVEYLKMWGSDHRPMLASVQNRPLKVFKRFMFDKRWIGKPGLKEAVKAGWRFSRHGRGSFLPRKIKTCRVSISNWKKTLVTNSEKLILSLQSQIDAAQENPEITSEALLELKWKLCDAYREEELYWQTKNLFTTSNPRDVDSVLRAVPVSITEEINLSLTRDFSRDEVKRALFSLNPEKTPGPDGLTALFYQRFWDIVGDDLVKLAQDFHSTGSFDESLNATNICLIPKTDRPRSMKEFRPISLCNVCYKVLSKILSLRLKKFLPDLISETQSAFVSGRLITDNILIAQENFHALRTNSNCRKNFMAIKTYMSKAFDRVEWPFLNALMLKMGFAQKWVDMIMFCISSVSYQVIINGTPKGHIKPSRGIRQGDPISPFIFILCTEALVAQLNEAEWQGKIQGLQIARASPSTSHLLFADDSLFFCRATPDQGTEVLNVIRRYGEASGQLLNEGKSSVMFGHEVSPVTRTNIKNILSIQTEGAILSKLSSAIANFWWKTRSESNGIHWIAWDKLCTQHSEGGLGFRTLGEFNQALLAKQFWRLLRFPNSLLSRVLRGRYYRFSDPLQIVKANRPSYGWRSIFSAKPLIVSGLRRTVGSGMLTRVWTDLWLPTIPPRPAKSVLAFQDPHLYVNDLLNRDTQEWKLELLNAIVDPSDIPLILGIRPSRTYLSDGYSWVHTKSGNYTVKSGYWAARNLSRPSCDLPFQGPDVSALQAQVWKTKTTRKLKHFMWQCLSGCVATCQRLFSRHIGREKDCLRCGHEEESINHHLFECPPARQVWALSPIPSSGTVFPRQSLFYNFDFLFWRGQELEIDVSNIHNFPWILWFIWKARNRFLFENIRVSPEETLLLATHEAEVWRRAMEADASPDPPPPPLVVHRPLSSPILECQCDASWLDSDPFSGLGWILLDDRGNFSQGHSWFGLKSVRRSLSPLHAEWDSLLWAMESMLALSHFNASFATDCSDILAVLEAPSDWPTFAAEYASFRDLENSFLDFNIGRIPRKENGRSDYLAKKARCRGVHFSYTSTSAPSWLFVEESLFPRSL